MKQLQVALLFISALLLALAKPYEPIASMVRARDSCENPIHRQEWRTLTAEQQEKYIDAVKCIMEKKAITTPSVPGAVSRYDDFSGVHIRQTDEIHGVGHFLPWHRFFTALYEQALRIECNYDGAQPYWDWTLDSKPGEFVNSPIFADNAFGGNGPYVPTTPENPPLFFDFPWRTGGGCVQNGPFKNMTVNLGPGPALEPNPRCLERDLTPYLGTLMSPEAVEAVLEKPDYWSMDFEFEGLGLFETFNGTSFDWTKIGVHGAGHFSVGGTYGAQNNPYSSSTDPIFFLHHSQVDRVWWLWQQRNPSVRLHEIAGPSLPQLFGPPDPSVANVTLSFPLQFNELSAAYNFTIADVMNTEGGILCYDYI